MADNSFRGGMDPWLARLGNLRNVVRQELVSRQLDSHLSRSPLQVLDVGAGQGTQALRLAAMGHEVTAVEPDERMRATFATYAAGLAGRVSLTLLDGEIDTLDAVVKGEEYDLVLCHGVLMYLPDSGVAIARLARRVAPGCLLSVVARNGAAMAWRPAVRGDWSTALELLDEVEIAAREGRDPRYLNELGVRARADTIESLTRHCEEAGLTIEAWYGVRLASDAVPVEAPTPHPDELAQVFDVEERFGRTDPYRRLGTLLHVVARRPA